MDDIISLIFKYQWVIFVLIIIVIILISFYRFKNVKHVLDAQAMKRNGTVKRTGLYSGNTLTFNHDNHEYAVSEYAGSRYQMPFTRIVTQLHKTVKSTLKIYSESWASGIGKKLGKQDIQIGSSSFDDHFIIQASDELFAINLITYSLQDKLLELRKFKPTLTLNSNRFMINIPKMLRIEQDYDVLIESAIAFVSRLDEM